MVISFLELCCCWPSFVRIGLCFPSLAELVQPSGAGAERNEAAEVRGREPQRKQRLWQAAARLQHLQGVLVAAL